VNRTDVYGCYYWHHSQKRVCATVSKKKLTPAVLRHHFEGEHPHYAAGLQSFRSSVDNGSTVADSLWVVVDLDHHNEKDDPPEVNESAAIWWYMVLKDRGCDCVLEDSDGKGGFHIWMRFSAAIPLEAARQFGLDLTTDWKDRGLSKPPEIFPKQDTATEFGSWVRLPGRHPKHPEHWSRIFDGTDFVSGNGAIDLFTTVKPIELTAEEIARLQEAAERKAIHAGANDGAKPETPEPTRESGSYDSKASGDDHVQDAPAPSKLERARAYLATIGAAISGEQGHNKTFYAACKIGPGFDLPYDDALGLLLGDYNPRCEPPWTEDEIRHKLDDAYKNVKERRGYLLARDQKRAEKAKAKDDRKKANLARGYLFDSQGEVLSCALNTTVWLKDPKNQKTVRYDTFNQAIFVNGERTSDSLYARLQVEVEASIGRVWGKDALITGLQAIAFENQFSPLVDWLESLKWDGTPRLSTFFQRGFGAGLTPDGDQDAKTAQDMEAYLADCARIFFLSAVVRAYKPGEKADVLPVIMGNQGIGKSEGMADLCPLRDWFTDDLHELTGERSGMVLQGKWICEFSETARLQRVTSNVAKAWIVRRFDRYRVPWGRHDQDFPRQCVFFATVNSGEPLEDTENRRYLPLWSTFVDRAWIQANREQLWAEAVTRYKAGEKWWVIPTSDAGDRCRTEQEKARQPDPWEDPLRSALNGMTQTTVFEASCKLAIPWDRFGKREQMRISDCLKSLGFTNQPEKRDEYRRRLWMRPKEKSQPIPTLSHPYARGDGIS
jgi:predicted P-loop ATPase